MPPQEKDKNMTAVDDDYGSNIIRKTLVKKLIAFIQIYALYIIIFGELGAGGGFQGGVILGSSMIVYILIFGLEEGEKRISGKMRSLLSSTGVLIYGGIGLLCVLAGGNFLEYGALPFGEPHVGSHYGIMGIEIGIGITVAGTMMILFCEMIGQDNL
jgi:multicomponent Na+:H+ antiporter subunit B